jgi:hypothetical protein
MFGAREQCVSTIGIVFAARFMLRKCLKRLRFVPFAYAIRFCDSLSVRKQLLANSGNANLGKPHAVHTNVHEGKAFEQT